MHEAVTKTKIPLLFYQGPHYTGNWEITPLKMPVGENTGNLKFLPNTGNLYSQLSMNLKVKDIEIFGANFSDSFFLKN